MIAKFDIGDMVFVVNARSPFWSHNGMVKDFEYDEEKDSIVYEVIILEDTITKLVEQDLRSDDMEDDTTEILK